MRAALPVVVLAALGAAGCGGAGAGGDVEDRAVAAGKRAGSSGVTVELPAGWHTTRWNDGNVTDPLTRIVAASAPIARTDAPCQVTRYAFPADAVALVVVEWRDPVGVHPPRPARFTDQALRVYPPPALECFAGPGGSTQFIERGRSFGAYLIVGREAPHRLLDEGRRVLDSLRVADRRGSAPPRLARNGISLTVPAGWDGRVLFREPSGRDAVIFQVASFTLPANAGFEPPRTLAPGAEDEIKAMGDGDVLVLVTDGVETGSPLPRPVTLGDLTQVRGARVPVGHMLATGAFCVEHRCLRVEVDFGGATAPAHVARGVNEVLESLVVGG